MTTRNVTVYQIVVQRLNMLSRIIVGPNPIASFTYILCFMSLYIYQEKYLYFFLFPFFMAVAEN